MSELLKEFDIKKAQDNLATLVNCWEPFQFIMISDSYVYGVSQTARVEPNDATIYQIDNNGEVMGEMVLVGGTHNSAYGVKTIKGKDYIYAPIHTSSGDKVVYKFEFVKDTTITENSPQAKKLGDFKRKKSLNISISNDNVFVFTLLEDNTATVMKFSLEEFEEGITDSAIKFDIGDKKYGYLQGFAGFGDKVYIAIGPGGTALDPVSKCYLYTHSLIDGSLYDKQWISWGSDDELGKPFNDYHEPEGMDFYVSKTGEPILVQTVYTGGYSGDGKTVRRRNKLYTVTNLNNSEDFTNKFNRKRPATVNLFDGQLKGNDTKTVYMPRDIANFEYVVVTWLHGDGVRRQGSFRVKNLEEYPRIDLSSNVLQSDGTASIYYFIVELKTSQMRIVTSRARRMKPTGWESLVDPYANSIILSVEGYNLR
ncbi:hypothetical protein HB790_10480 [Listeria welshimeri]|uniref:P68 RBP/TagC-like beta-propeller domain-containing protein n=1 Tax=Listeria welshimeri TaxID=1643 RepID=A0ABX4ICZ5_LISWE|nr:hypothetical protein [Listeria welshimeri]MBC1355538.1 hypothetical protein [Listeria welshimeri]MBC1410660.1 hypothetical protein [Listeria welshimeri]MBC1452564.1 hypothetical protein [Listeria welshimeri]MBC1455310.1 hypothetical protein [Listeria welshimeri]MBC1642607.1 hypothetical protein [Listeria welshimeri]